VVKKRLDQILVEQGFFKSREKARTAIMSNYVKVGGQVESKPGTQVNIKKLEENSEYIQVEDKSSPYVSRGAYKLEKGIQEFKIDLKEKVILDLGSSTGGFTDYSLQHGARKSIAVDVGKAQLDYKLRKDPRVLSLEGKNIKDLKTEDLDGERIDLVVADLSFISVLKILDNLQLVLEGASSPDLRFIFLIKPQFEAGKKIADKFRGIITDEKIRQEILDGVLKGIEEKGFQVLGQVESPIKGAKGNVEYLVDFMMPPLARD